MAKDIQVCFAVHVDAVAGWIGSYGGEDFAGRHLARHVRGRGRHACGCSSCSAAGASRRAGSCPGHSAETFPDQMKRVADAGHEFGVHGYTHENPIAMTPDQEEAILVKCIEVLSALSGKKPRGYIAPWWELSNATAGLLLEARLRLRPQHVPRRLHAVLCARRRHAGP